MQKLIDQVTKDKTDLKNREALKRMQEKANWLNAVNNEKRRRNEMEQLERIENETLLRGAVSKD